MPGDPALGMPKRAWHRFHRCAGGSGIGSISMQRVWHRFHRYARGSGIGDAKGSDIVLPIGILNAKGSGIGSV